MDPKVVIVGATPAQMERLRIALGDRYREAQLARAPCVALVLESAQQPLPAQLPKETTRVLLCKAPYSSEVTLAICANELQGAGPLDIESVELLALCDRSFATHQRTRRFSAEQLSRNIDTTRTQARTLHRLELMVNSMADGLLMSEIDRPEVLINPAARQLLGISHNNPITQGFLKDSLGFYPFDLVAVAPDSQELLREELRIGDRRLHSMVSSVRDRDNRLVGVVVVLRDFSEAPDYSRQQSEFISNVSHEFRSPLTSISGSIDIVLNNNTGTLSDKQRQYLRIAKESCHSLNRVVDTLLEVARPDEDDLALNWRDINLEELAQEATDRYRSVAESKNIDLRFSCSTEATSIRGDSSRLLQVLHNLLSNALKFTPPHGKVQVEVFGPSVAASLVGVSVYNNGVPIEDGAREQIFQRFEHGQENSIRRIGGTGLGLAMSRTIVEAHRGRIWAESIEEGAKFVFTLPAGHSKTPQAPRAQYASVQVPHTTSTVLLVDADTNSSYILKGILMSAGHVVVVARDIDSVLPCAEKHHPSLIVVHIAPNISEPLSLLEILRHSPDTRNASVLVVSGDALSPELCTLAQNWLSLPVQEAQFRQECSRLLREAGLSDGNRVLVVDDNPRIRNICAEILRMAELTVREAADGHQALREIERFRPDVILLDVMMPTMDGFETAQKIKASAAGAMTPIIFLSARGETEDKVRAFRAGAEDYIVKPFVSEELVARVRKAMTRSHRDLGASPTTELPGGNVIAAEIETRLQFPDTAFCYLDLDNLKAYNDHYSYAKADGIIRQIGDLIRSVVAKLGTSRDFIGHVAGDDFVFLTSCDAVDRICNELCKSFDRLVPLYYNKSDRQAGYIETNDRYGEMRRFPLMSVSISVVTNSKGAIASYSKLAAAAAEGKRQAKAIPGSCYVRDGQQIDLA